MGMDQQYFFLSQPMIYFGTHEMVESVEEMEEHSLAVHFSVTAIFPTHQNTGLFLHW